MFHKILRILSYLPILWKSEDWDYGFFYDLMAFKLRRMARYHELHGVTDARFRTAKQIRYALYLIERLQKNDFCRMEEEEHRKKWGDPDLEFRDTKDSVGEFKALHVKYPNVKTEEDERRQTEEFLAIMWKEDTRRKDAKRRLFRHLERYIDGWWD